MGGVDLADYVFPAAAPVDLADFVFPRAEPVELPRFSAGDLAAATYMTDEDGNILSDENGVLWTWE